MSMVLEQILLALDTWGVKSKLSATKFYCKRVKLSESKPGCKTCLAAFE